MLHAIPILIVVACTICLPIATSSSAPPTSSTSKYTLLHVEAHDAHALHLIRQLQLNDFKYELDFWKSPSLVSNEADVMVPRGKQERIFRQILSFANATVSTSVNDVEKLIMRNEGPRKTNWLHDDPILDSEPDTDHSKIGQLKKAKYPFGDYASYAEMVKYMRTIEFYYPRIAKIVRIGTTHEGKPIEGLRIGARSSQKKRAVWVDGNIHAREWASSHTALFFINQLVSNYGLDQQLTHYVDTLDFYVVPCLNPDGYEYTRSSPIPTVRLWRKNRSPEVCRPSVWGGEKCCRGVDLNRNFQFHWSERGSSYEPCSNIYHGDEVFSEPETRAVRDFLNTPVMRGRVDAFVTLHSYAQLWIYPYSHEEQNYPEDIGELRKTARKAITRLSNVYGTSYRMGTGADTLSPAAGGSDDWAKSALNVKYVYLIELRPQMELSNGFILHKKELIPTAIETFEGFREVVDAVLRLNNVTTTTTTTKAPIVTKSSATSSATTTRKTISDLQMLKQQLRMRLLAAERRRPTPPSAPPTMDSVTGMTTRHVAEPSTTTTTTVLSTTTTTTTMRMEDTTMAQRASTFGFYTATKPAAFLDPECRDMRYSCGFWLKNNKAVCEEQESFMRAQCSYTCHFCTSFIKRV